MNEKDDNKQKELKFIVRKRTKFLALPLYFVKFIISDEKVSIRQGFFGVTEDDAMMYKIQDVRLARSFIERIFGLGTIICYTGDKTHPELQLQHIKKSKIIKEFIITASESARIKRRTVHTLGIDVSENEDIMEE